MNERSIRASYDDDSVIVYQAFNSDIALAALKDQTFISPPFKKERMTWIKPSFLWMMYRSGWATKKNQDRILSIRIKKSGFEWSLQNACLSHFDNSIYTSYQDWKVQLEKLPVRVQWDPEKNILLQSLPYRSIQIGLSGIAVDKYITDWIIQITDITVKCKDIHQLITEGEIDLAKSLLPIEKVYCLSENISQKITSS